LSEPDQIASFESERNRSLLNWSRRRISRILYCTEKLGKQAQILEGEKVAFGLYRERRTRDDLTGVGRCQLRYIGRIS
jgi:hypothetical protein